jgi:hypothetical protein
MSDRRSSRLPSAEAGTAIAGADESRSAGDDGRLLRLIGTIEGEIVPRLLMSLAGSLAAAREGSERDGSGDLARLTIAAARRLEQLWERDECDLDQVLAGLHRLEAMLRDAGKQTP